MGDFTGTEKYAQATYNGPMIEPAPVYTPMTEPTPPNTRWAKFSIGVSPNTMATGEPKEYPSTNTADPDNSGPDYPDPIKEEKTESKVDVASIMENASDDAAAAEAIAAAVNEAIASEAAALTAEYSAKIMALPASIPGRIAGYTSARIDKTKSDTDRNGQPYDPVKLSLSDVMPQMTSPVEDLDEDKKEKKSIPKKTADELKEELKDMINSWR